MNKSKAKSAVSVQHKVQELRAKVDTLKKGVNKLEFENSKLITECSKVKRSKTILGLQNEMQRQDMVIELLRSHLTNESLFDSTLTSELDKGPKRVRPPTREELYIELGKHKHVMRDLEDEWIKLVPRADPFKYQEKEVQTEDDWIENSQASIGLGQLDSERLKKEAYTNKRLTELRRVLNLQKSTLEKIKHLIENKGLNSQKIASIKEDYEDLKIDIEMKNEKLEDIRNQNAETQSRLQSLKTTKHQTLAALMSQITAAQQKLESLNSENASFQDEKTTIFKKIREIAEDDSAAKISTQIAETREKCKNTDSKTQDIKNILQGKLEETDAIEKMIEKLKKQVQNVHDSVKHDKERIEQEFEVQQTEENDLEWGIRDLKKKVGEARLREVQLLETIEALELELAVKQAKSASLNLLSTKGTSYLQEEDQIETFRLNYETKLNEKILENTALKRKVQEAEDLLFLLKKEPDAENVSKVDSKIESMKTFEVLQPEERPELNLIDSISESLNVSSLSKELRNITMKKKAGPSKINKNK